MLTVYETTTIYTYIKDVRNHLNPLRTLDTNLALTKRNRDFGLQ